MAYVARVRELSKDGFEPDSRVATLSGLEKIQEALGLDDEGMEAVVPQFSTLADDPSRIERTAAQVNRAASGSLTVSVVPEGMWRTWVVTGRGKPRPVCICGAEWVAAEEQREA